jgi:hypothetical protein
MLHHPHVMRFWRYLPPPTQPTSGATSQVQLNIRCNTTKAGLFFHTPVYHFKLRRSNPSGSSSGYPLENIAIAHKYYNRQMYTNISPGNDLSPLSLSLAVGSWLGRRRVDIGSNSSSDSPSDLPSDSLTEQPTCLLAEQLSQQ